MNNSLETKATTINLKAIDTDVAKLSGRAAKTPISMQSLWNEVQNLKVNVGKANIVYIGRELDPNWYTYNLGSNSNKNVIAVARVVESDSELESTNPIGYSITDVIRPGETKTSVCRGGSTTMTVKHNGSSISLKSNTMSSLYYYNDLVTLIIL